MASKIIHKHSSVITDGIPKLPTKEQLEYGELAINYSASAETITLRNSSDEIVEFKSKDYFENILNENNYCIVTALNHLDDKKQDKLVDGETIKTINGESILGEGNIETKSLIEVTYNELVVLRNESKLITGSKYRIIDYVTTTTQSNTSSSGHPFDVILEATSENTLSEDVKVIKRVNDASGYFDNSDLNAWNIKYCLDNDISRFAWADPDNGKGVIYYMKDEHNNECWYDFKNIQFKCVVTQTHNETQTEFKPDGYDYAYTFTDYDGNDLSLTSNARNNCIKRYNDSTSAIQYLNHTLFISSSVHNNTIKENSYCNVFYVNTCYYNTIGIEFQNNFINTYSEEGLKSVHNNIIGNLFKSNRILSSFSRNTIGNTTNNCDFFNAFAFNKLGDNSWHIDFNYPVSYCEFGSYIQYCIFNNTDAYPPVVDEMKWCYIGNGLEGAQYFPCCQMVTVQSRSLFNSSDNFHINDVELIDGRTLAEALTQEHTEHLYVYKIGDKYGVSPLSGMQKSEPANIPTLVSNPGTSNDNANNYGYVGTLQNIGINGDIIVIDTITSYVRTGAASPNSTTPVWCRLLKFVNDAWKIVYQSTDSKKIGDYEQGSEFSFKMERKDSDDITPNDKIAIVYSNTDNIDEVLNSTELGFKCISNKTGGLNAELSNSSTGATNYQTFLIISYLSMSDTPVNAVTIENEQTITGRKRFNGGINIAGKSLITSSIDGGELKVLHNESSKGFILRTRNTSDNILPLELLSTNGSASYTYKFPALENSNDNATIALNDIATTEKNGLMSSEDKRKLNSIDSELSAITSMIEENEYAISVSLTDLNENKQNKINVGEGLNIDNGMITLDIPTLKTLLGLVNN